MALIDLNQAAQILGISTDELVEMRERNEIHGYRDGSSWKFKEEEVQRVKDEGLGGGGEEDASILVSEQELGASNEGATSTIIGKNDQASAEDSDIQLASDSDPLGSGIGSDIGSDDLLDSDLKIDKPTGSELSLEPTSETGSGSDLSLEPGTGSGDLDLASDLNLGSDDLDLGDDDLTLSEDDDDDLVLGGSGNLESDITLGTGDTGINLLSPSDSGLSLEEEPLELGSSVSSLELPEDDDVPAGVGSDVPTDPEFMLSQPDEMSDDDDSGSQVIALEDSSAFDQDAATMLQANEPALLSEDTSLDPNAGGLGGFGEEAAAGAMLGAGMAAGAVGGAAAAGDALGSAAMPMPAAPTATEAPYSIWNILGLLCIVLFLSMSGMLMIDVIRNMWAWETANSISTGMTDGIIGALGMEE